MNTEIPKGEDYIRDFYERKEMEERLNPIIHKMKFQEGEYVIWGEEAPVKLIKGRESPAYSLKDIKYIIGELKIQNTSFHSFKRKEDEVWNYYQSDFGGEVSENLVMIVVNRWDSQEQKWQKHKISVVNAKGILKRLRPTKEKMGK